MAAMLAADLFAQSTTSSNAAGQASLRLAKDLVLIRPAGHCQERGAQRPRSAATEADVVAKFSRGQTVTVYEEMTLAKPATNDPARWSRIALPTNAAAWVFAEYVDTNTLKTTRRVNVRGGPGEGFKSLLILDKGTTVTEVRRKRAGFKFCPPPMLSVSWLPSIWRCSPPPRRRLRRLLPQRPMPARPPCNNAPARSRTASHSSGGCGQFHSASRCRRRHHSSRRACAGHKRDCRHDPATAAPTPAPATAPASPPNRLPQRPLLLSLARLRRRRRARSLARGANAGANTRPNASDYSGLARGPLGQPRRLRSQGIQHSGPNRF